MNGASYHILPLEPSYHAAALAFEKGIIQGKSIQLEILKDKFLSRAIPFDSHYSCMALTDEDEIIGTAIGASTVIKINDTEFDAGFAFDTKVNLARRGQHIGRTLAKTLYSDFFKPQALCGTFMMAKTSNLPVMKVAANTVSQTWYFPFVYLTIPTTARLSEHVVGRNNHSFKVTIFNKENLSQEYFLELENGLGYFRTYKAYRLKIRKVSRSMKTAMSILKLFNPLKYKNLPAENDELSVATLYNHSPSTLSGLNKLLEKLKVEGVDQLLVSCCRNDSVYNYLKNISINTYPYCLVSDFEVKPTDKLTIDVRCL